ncbi:MAG: hypothetical protein WD971_07955 [Pirellulales bacterium]
MTIRIDYSIDNAGSKFFGSGNPQGAGAQAKAALDAAAAFYSGILNDTFVAIQKPPDLFGSLGGSATWSWQRSYSDPSTGFSNAELNIPIAANEFVVLVGARDLPASELGRGGPGGYNWHSGSSGPFTSPENDYIAATTAQFKSAVETRGESSGFARWGGSLAVDNNANWHFNHTTAPTGGKSDFYSVVLHELAHAIGLGASQEWQNLVSGATFVGTQAMTQYSQGGPVPLNSAADTGHWSSVNTGSTVYGGSTAQQPLMVSALPANTRRQLTNLDAASLVDIGWEIALPQPVPGDYNHNGIVDAADFTIWRNTLGSTTDLRANGNNSGASAGKIDQADYAFWKSNFGDTSGSGAGSIALGVPEPASLLLLVTAALLTFLGNPRLNR